MHYVAPTYPCVYIQQPFKLGALTAAARGTPRDPVAARALLRELWAIINLNSVFEPAHPVELIKFAD